MLLHIACTRMLDEGGGLIQNFTTRLALHSAGMSSPVPPAANSGDCFAIATSPSCRHCVNTPYHVIEAHRKRWSQRHADYMTTPEDMLHVSFELKRPQSTLVHHNQAGALTRKRKTNVSSKGWRTHLPGRSVTKEPRRSKSTRKAETNRCAR